MNGAPGSCADGEEFSVVWRRAARREAQGSEGVQGIKGIQVGTYGGTHAEFRVGASYTSRRERMFFALKELYMGSTSISVDEFQALEQKVLQTVELIKREREGRFIAEAEVTAMKAELLARTEELELKGQEIAALRQELATAGDANAEVKSLQREREAVRLRVEKMLASMDEIV